MNSKQRKAVAAALENGTMKRCVLLTLATVSFLAGCATTIDYSPHSEVPIDQAKQTILRGIEEMGGVKMIKRHAANNPSMSRVPNHVEVTDEKIRMEFDRTVADGVFLVPLPGGITTVAHTETTYFKTLEHLRLQEYGRGAARHYFVQALDAAGGERLTIYTATEEFAKELMDSLATMMQFAKQASPAQ